MGFFNHITRLFDRLVFQRRRMLLDHPFHGQLATRLEMKETREYDTFATNGKDLYYNPDFGARMSDENLIFVWAHETEHVARLHPWRINGRDPLGWNRACDFPINHDLILAKVGKPPEGILVNWDYLGMGPEQIYALEMKAKAQAVPKPSIGQPGQPGQPGTGQGQPQPQPGQPKPGANAPQPAGTQPQPGSQPGQQPGQPQPGQGPGQPQPGQPGQSSQPGQPSNAGQPAGTQPGQPQSAPVPTGEFLPGEDLEDACEAVIAVDRAITAARRAGKLPGYIERTAEDSVKPRVDWAEVLRRFIVQLIPSDQSWVRPDRRHVSSGLYLPGLVRDTCPRLAIAVDTSGSITQRFLDKATAELTEILREVRPEEIVIYYADTEVRKVERYGPDEPFKLIAYGGGGTAFQPTLDSIMDAGDDIAAIVYFTDLYGSDNDRLQDPGVPVLWVTEEWSGETGPFGETIRIPCY